MKIDDVSSDKYFFLSDGSIIKNISELSSSLKSMSDDVFNYHVNNSKNDFANWVKHVISDDSLAESISSVLDKLVMAKLISDKLNSYKNSSSSLNSDSKKVDNFEFSDVAETKSFSKASSLKKNVGKRKISVRASKSKTVNLKKSDVSESISKLKYSLSKIKQTKSDALSCLSVDDEIENSISSMKSFDKKNIDSKSKKNILKKSSASKKKSAVKPLSKNMVNSLRSSNFSSNLISSSKKSLSKPSKSDDFDFLKKSKFKSYKDNFDHDKISSQIDLGSEEDLLSKINARIDAMNRSMGLSSSKKFDLESELKSSSSSSKLNVVNSNASVDNSLPIKSEINGVVSKSDGNFKKSDPDFDLSKLRSVAQKEQKLTAIHKVKHHLNNAKHRVVHHVRKVLPQKNILKKDSSKSVDKTTLKKSIPINGLSFKPVLKERIQKSSKKSNGTSKSSKKSNKAVNLFKVIKKDDYLDANHILDSDNDSKGQPHVSNNSKQSVNSGNFFSNIFNKHAISEMREEKKAQESLTVTHLANDPLLNISGMFEFLKGILVGVLIGMIVLAIMLKGGL